jgi:hypothetical protein
VAVRAEHHQIFVGIVAAISVYVVDNQDIWLG